MTRFLTLLCIFATFCGYFNLGDAQKLNRSSRNAPEMRAECRRSLSNCTDMVTPYLMNENYMFPQNIDHVNDMCRMWSSFVDCTRRYISDCFEEKRRALFHKSVEGSIDTVHAICSSRSYQKEYLERATCFKRVSVEHCGENYQNLIATVANPNSYDDHICCHYSQFRKCVNTPLFTECGRKSKNLMDHSMSFLISRCHLYNREHEKCPKPKAYTPPKQNNEDVPSREGKSIQVEDNDNENSKLLTATTTDAVSSESPKIGISTEATGSGEASSTQAPKIAMAGRAFTNDEVVEEYKVDANSPEVENVDNQLHDSGIDDAIVSVLEKKIDLDAKTPDTATEESMIVYTIKPQFQVGGSPYSISLAPTFHEASLLVIFLSFVGFTLF